MIRLFSYGRTNLIIGHENVLTGKHLMKYSMGKCALGITKNPSIDDFFSGLPIRSSLDVSFSSPTTVDREC